MCFEMKPKFTAAKVSRRRGSGTQRDHINRNVYQAEEALMRAAGRARAPGVRVWFERRAREIRDAAPTVFTEAAKYKMKEELDISYEARRLELQEEATVDAEATATANKAGESLLNTATQDVSRWLRK